MSKCPVCDFSEPETFFAVTACEAAQHFVLAEGNAARHRDLTSHIRTLWGKDECSLRHCGKCGFRFADPFVAGDSKFYNLSAERIGYPRDKWEYRRTLKDLSTHGFRAARILEVGAGIGHFLDKLADAYVPRSGIVALEYNDAAVQILNGKGYSTRRGDVREVQFSHPFDAIFMYQVLEHMDGLDELFRRVAGLLRPGGQLFVSVPNTKRIRFNEMSGALLDMPPNHIGGWTPEAFGILGSRHGLRLDLNETEPFALGQFIKQDVVYSYLRRSQQRGTFANKSRALRSHRLGKAIGSMVAAAMSPRRLNVWRRAAVRGAELGGSLWVKFSAQT
jgi:2-polyprenyl-3-methyl-5-hydroxy-6-metoxy-1,4-benzoquinol methylase